MDIPFRSGRLRHGGNGTELAVCLQATRPGMAVFSLGDMRDAGDEAVQAMVTGEAVLLASPVAEPRLMDAAGLLEERRGAPALAPQRHGIDFLEFPAI